MQAQQILQNALRDKLTDLQQKNPKYSLRAFATRLQINSGILSGILNGKRRLSPKQILKIANQISLTPLEINKIQALIVVEDKKPLVNLEPLQLTNDQFLLISDALHYAILSLMETESFRPNISWISDRLEKTEKTVEKAVRRLQRLELISIDKKGQWKLNTSTSKIGDGQANAAIRKYHDDRLMEARDKLHTTDLNDRDFHSTTLAINRSQLPLAKEMIRDFKKKLAAVLEVGEKDEVYRFSFQLYPVTKVQKRNIQ